MMASAICYQYFCRYIKQNRYGHKLTIKAKLIFSTDIRYLVLTSVPLVMYTKRFVYVRASHSGSAASVGVDLAGRTSPSDWRRGEGSARRGAAGGQPGTAEQRTRLVRPHRYHTYTEAVRSHFYKMIVGGYSGRDIKTFCFRRA